MEEIDQEVLARIAGDVLASGLDDEVIATARQIFEAGAAHEAQASRRRELATVEREQARLTDAVAAGVDAPILIARLRETERRDAS